MPFCYSPWTNFDVNPKGDMSPCCKFLRQQYTEQYNVQQHTIEEYKNSKFLNTVKQEFLQGNWPKGCERCKIEEENGIKSKRQMDAERWDQHYSTYNVSESSEFVTASVAFGNTCNLTCITCGPHASSRWQQEHKIIVGQDIKPFHFYKKDFVNELIGQGSNLVHIDIPGGEPFLSGIVEQQLLLKHYIESGRCKDMSLHYTTNATVFPDNVWWELWKHFGEVEIQLSLDATEQRAEYIRHPCDWNVVNENILRYQHQRSHNIRLSISHTLSAYNVFYLDKFVDWCYNQNLPSPWIGRVHNPVHMRPTVWPADVKQIIINQLAKSKYKEVTDWTVLMTQQDDSEHFEMFRQRVKQHDQYRKVNFAETFPELAEYI